MIHVGDITKLNGAELPVVDVVTGGSPCQDLSVAGKRAGLAGERSGLFMEQVRIVKEMREHDRSTGRTGYLTRPRYMLWENVPGAFSSNKGEDFRAVLEEIAKVEQEDAHIPRPEGSWPYAGCVMGDGWSIAWRLHDAQFWGVPQRRKRIALVADFGGQSAPEILFERKGMCRDPEESGEEGEGAASNAQGSTGKAISFQERYESNAMKSSNPHSGIYEAETARTLDNNGGSPACNQGGMAVVQSAGFDGNMGAKAGNIGYEEEKAPTLNAGKQMQCICIEGNGSRPSHKGDGYAESETMYTLNSTEHHSVAYRKTSHAKSAEDGQGWAETEVNDTLNAFDSGETRTPTVVLENHPADSRVKISEDGMVQTLSSRMGTGGGNVPMVMETYQKTTGSLCASGYDKLGTQKSPTLATTHYGEPVACITMDNDKKDVTCLQRRFSTVNVFENGKTPTLEAGAGEGGNNVPMVCIDMDNERRSGAKISYNLAPTLSARAGTGGNNVPAIGEATVRRLTPLECERLQGFPSEKRWDVSKMTKDEYIAWNLAEGNIVADPDTGKVFGTRGPGGVPYEKPRELKGSELNGYRVVSIRNGATKLQCRVHRIIWISQNGVIPEGYVIDHINNNKSDNRLSNLQLLTPKQNSSKARKDGLYLTGLDNKATKLDPQLKDDIAFLYQHTTATQRQLAEMYGVSKSRINQIIKEVGWTDIGEWTDSKGKTRKCSDSARYKALGNSIAIPFWFYILRRMAAQYERPATLGSLFDGIGGFPLCWERCNGKGTAIWASEIEEFPIAVTKKRFGDS